MRVPLIRPNPESDAHQLLSELVRELERVEIGCTKFMVLVSRRGPAVPIPMFSDTAFFFFFRSSTRNQRGMVDGWKDEKGDHDG